MVKRTDKERQWVVVWTKHRTFGHEAILLGIIQGPQQGDRWFNNGKRGDYLFFCIFQRYVYVNGCNASFPHVVKSHKCGIASEIQWMLLIATSLTSASGLGAYKLQMSICGSSLKSIINFHSVFFFPDFACSSSKTVKLQLELLLWDSGSIPDLPLNQRHSSTFWEIK